MNTQAVTITEEVGGTEYRHPAFGVIAISRTTSSKGQLLFGSDLKHRNTIRVEICTAKSERSLSRFWNYPNKRVMVFEMSESQWARMVSSIGMGDGVPITFDLLPADPTNTERVPRIAEMPKVVDLHAAEIDDIAIKTMEDAKALEARLVELVAGGKATKTQLNELLGLTKALTQKMPRHVNFINESSHKAMSNIVNECKTEIDAYASMTIVNSGLSAFAEFNANTQKQQLLDNCK